MSARKRKAIQIFIIIAVILIFCAYNIPIPVHKTYSALEINMADSSYCVERTVSLDGYYHINLFSKNSFSGSFEVSGYEALYADRELSNIEISESGAGISYTSDLSSSDAALDILYFGRLYSDITLNDMVIGFVIDANGNNNSTADCNVIVTNADSREEAYHAAEKVFWPEEHS